MRGWFAGIVILLGSIPVFAQATAAIQGHSYLGGTQAQVSGLSSTNYLNGIIPHATITVYLTGTQTLATIYADASNTPLSNPFTSNAVGSSNPGGYLFFAAVNQGYDVVASGGIAPNTYPNPVTLCVDCYAGSQITPSQPTTFQHNGTNLADQTLLNFNDTTPAAPGGYINIIWQANGAGSLSGYTPLASSTVSSQCFVGTGGLVGAFTDSSGIVKQPLCIGNGPTSLQVPTGATQLLLGVDDNKFSDNGGSFVISASVNGGTATQYTVQSTSEPWDVATNPSYTYGTTGGTAPILGPTGLNPGDTVTITYVSGAVSCDAGVSPPSDANGYLTTPPGNADCAGGPTGTYVDPTYGKFPTYYMGSGGGATFNALTAAATGGAPPGTTFNGSAPVTLDYHSLGAPGISGTPVTGNCVDWASANTLGDAGSPCGSGGGGVTQITGPSSTVTGAMTFTGAGVSQSGNTFTFSGSGGSSQPTPFAYTFYVSAGTTYAVNNQTQTVAYSGTDAAVIINDVLGATVTTGATLYFKPGTYNLNSCTLETVTYTTLCYAVGIPATNSGTNYPQFKFIGDSTMSGSQDSPATSGVIFNVTSAAVTAAGTNTLAAFWMRPSTVHNSYYSGTLFWNDHIEFENFAINFPDNTHANEVAIDALEASYLGLKDVQAGFVTAPTALGASNTIAFITPATPSDGSRLVNSYASPGWDTGFQINTEHSYLEATVSFENTTGYSYGGQRNRNSSPIYHNSQMVGIQCYDDVNCLTSTDANVSTGSQLDIVGLDLEYINTGVWAYSTGFTTGANLGGTLSWTNTLTNVGRGSLTTPFPNGSGTNYEVENSGTVTAGIFTGAAVVAYGSKTLNQQGLSLQWNTQAGYGEGDFVNYYGGGISAAGFNFYNVATAAASGAPIMSVRGNSSGTTDGTSFTLAQPATNGQYNIQVYDHGGTPLEFIGLNGTNFENYRTVTGGIAHSVISTGVWGWLNGTDIVNSTPDAGLSRCAAGVVCVGNGNSGDKSGTLQAAAILPGILYSAAGTALPTCNASEQGATAVVSDATAPTYMGAYTSGGAITAAVICSYDGTTYSWKTR